MIREAYTMEPEPEAFGLTDEYEDYLPIEVAIGASTPYLYGDDWPFDDGEIPVFS